MKDANTINVNHVVEEVNFVFMKNVNHVVSYAVEVNYVSMNL
jgi:hypothetical protein